MRKKMINIELISPAALIRRHDKRHHIEGRVYLDL